jgi:hypothetical protein
MALVAPSAPSFGTAYANDLWSNPRFSIGAGLDTDGTNIDLHLPTESWHSYQLQYRNALTNPIWSNLGSAFKGDDTLDTIISPALSSSRFYRVVAQ